MHRMCTELHECALSCTILSGHGHKYDDVRGKGFFGQTRRERRDIPQRICKERATKSGRKRPAALWVATNLACGFVARRLQPTLGMRPPRARHRPNWAQ